MKSPKKQSHKGHKKDIQVEGLASWKPLSIGLEAMQISLSVDKGICEAENSKLLFDVVSLEASTLVICSKSFLVYFSYVYIDV
jgi:hypothetical protein